MYYALYFLFSLPAILFFYNFYKSFRSPLRSIPGPFLTRITNLWYFNRVRCGQFHTENITLHQRYGPIVRLGPSLYSLSNPDKAVYGHTSKFPKSVWYEGWKHPSPDRWTLFPDQNIQRHGETRKRFQNLYSLSSLVGYEPYADDCLRIFSQRLDMFSKSGEIVDMAHWFQCYAFDLIGHITYSQRFGFLDRGEDVSGFIKALDRSMIYSTLVGIYAWAHPYLYAVMEKLPGSGASGRSFVMKFVTERMKARDEERRKRKEAPSPSLEGNNGTGAEGVEGTPKDFLDRLMDAHDADPTKVTNYHVFMMGLSNIIAGSDTTAVSLSSVLYHLLRNPHTLSALRSEIDSSHHQTSNPNTFSFKESQDMPYLQAVIKEALRLHPATGLPLWRVVPPGGATVCGQYFPGGSTVGLNSWVAHYSSEGFGATYNQFIPERWLPSNSSPEQLKHMEAFYMPFGLGSRTCLGRHISMLEISKLIPYLIKNYDFELQDPEREWEAYNYWFVKPTRLNVRVRVRQT